MFDIDHLYLASYNYGKIDETVVTGGDNFEVTVGLSKTEGLTEEQLEQNGLLNCMMTLLKDVENSINCLYRSIDNDTDLAESLSKQLPISKSNKHLAYNFGTLHEQVERRNDYINGKKGIGPFALNVTNQMLTYLFGVKFKDTKFTKFTGIWRLDHLVDDNDAYISSWLSAFINANVDIVKDPWVVRLNVNPFTYNVLNLLVRSGMGQTGVWFLCQPIIRELANVEERTKSNFSKDPSLPKYKFKQKLISEVLDKYLIQHDDATISEYTTNSDAQSIQSRIEVVNLILDNKEALRYIAVNPNATMVKLNDGSDVSVSWFQGQIYYAFLSLQKYIQAMNKLVQYTKIDTRKHGKNFIQIQRYLAMYNELFHPQDTSKSLWDLESLTNLANNSWIEYKTVNAINLPLHILANQVYTANPEFSSVVLHFARRLARSANDEYGFTEDLIKKLSNGLQTAIKARYMSAYAKQVLGRSDEYIRELFYGSSPLISIARRLNGLKYAIESVPEFERLKGNYIIEKLRPQPQQESVALSDGSVARQPQFITIDSNIDGSRTDENMMIDAWKDLLNDPNERVRMFAEDLILYTFFTTGEYKGWNKLFKYVPSAWIRGEIRGGNVDVDGIQCTSFSDYVEQTLNGRMPDLIPMLQEVVSNNFLNYGICTTMQLKNEDGTTNFINPDASSPVLVANAVSKSDIDSMPLYISVKKPNTKGRKAGSYNVYKMTGEINATNGVYPIYTMIEKRGYSQFNNDIYEYGIDLQYKENETKIPNASAEEIESRISDACEKIENTGKQGHKWTWNEILIDLTGAFYGEPANDDVATDEQSSVPSNPSVIHQYKGVWTRSEVQKDTNSLYIFTDNTDRDSGSGLIDPNSRYAQKYGQGKHYPTRTQAVIRGLDNAMPISTQHWYHPGAKGPTGVWTDNDFEEFKKTIDAEIQDIIDEWNTGKYKRIVIGDGDAFFNSSISNISVERVPKLYSYLKSKVEELYRYVDEHKPESQPSQATSGIKYESDGGVSVEYTPTGKQKQTYTVKGNKIFNNNGDEVFKEDSVDRNKIFANLAVLQGRAVVVEHKGIKYVVNNRNQIISGVTGKIMQWGEENGDRNAIIQAAEKRFKEKDVKAAMEKSVYNSEEQSIIDKAKKDGTFMMAPNGKPTNLTERQWVRARTKAFKDQFGDWEKEYTPQTNIYKENPWEKYMETEDTGRTYIGHSGKTIPIIINKGIKYVHPVEKIATTDKDPFGFNSYNVNNLIIVGKEVDADRNFNGICQVTARACKDFLKNRYNIESSVVIIKAKSPVKDDIIDHWVNVLSINGEAYIYDMPQTEYIKQTKPLVYDGRILDGYYEGVIISKYTPRLIKVTEENLSKFYEDNNENDKQIKVIKSTIKQLNKDGESIDLNNLQYKPAYDKNVSKAVDENGEPLQQELIKQYPELTEVSRSGGFTWARTSDNSYEVSTLASKNKMSKQEGDARFSALNAKFKDGTIIDGIDVGGMTIEDVYQNVIKKSGKGKAPSRNSKLFVDTTPKLKGKMSFAFGNQRANGVTATTTLEAIKRGERTATTRYTSDGNIDYWKHAKVGDVIEFSDKNGEKVLVRVTKELHQLPTSTTAEEWSAKEGWDTSRFKQRVKPQIDKGDAYQMEFEYIDQSKEAMEDFSYRESYLPLWQEWARQNPELIEELRINANGKTLTDQFAGTKERPGRVSQARALADILNSQYKSNSQNNELLQSTTQPIKTEKTPKNYQKYIDVIQKYFDIGYTTGRIGKDDAKQVIQKLHIHIDEDSYLFDAMKDNNLSETDLLNALYMLASHLDKPEVTGRTKLSDQQVDKLLDDMKNSNILTDILNMNGGIYRIHESNDGLIIDTQLMSDLDFLLQNKKYEPIYRQLLNYMMNDKYMDEYYGDIVDIFNIDHEDLSGLIQVDSTFDNVNQLELFSDKDFEEGIKIKNNCKGK